jgi:hypothetical protein
MTEGHFVSPFSQESHTWLSLLVTTVQYMTEGRFVSPFSHASHTWLSLLVTNHACHSGQG